MGVPTLAVDVTFHFFSYSETGALCAMKEVDLNPDDPKSAECIKQLEQVSPNVLLIGYKNSYKVFFISLCYEIDYEETYLVILFIVLGNTSSPTVEAPKYCSILRQ